MQSCKTTHAEQIHEHETKGMQDQHVSVTLECCQIRTRQIPSFMSLLTYSYLGNK